MSVRSRNYKIIIQRDSNALTTRVIQLLDAGDEIYDARDTAVAAAASASASATQAEGIVTSAQDTIDQAVEAAQTAQEAAEAAMSAVVSPFVEGVIGTYNADHPSQNQIILRGSFAGKQAIDLNLGYGADQYPSGFNLASGSDADGEYTVISPASGDWPIGMAFYARGVYRSASDPAEAADRAEAAAQAAEAAAAAVGVSLTSFGFTAGMADATLPMQNALNYLGSVGGGTLIIPPSVGNVNVSTVTCPGNVKITGGGTIYPIGNNSAVILASGSLGSAVALTADATETTVTIGDASVFSVGDYIVLTDNVSYTTTDAGYKNGQMLRIQSIAGGVLTVEGKIPRTMSDGLYTVANSAAVRKVNLLAPVSIEGITFAGNWESTSQIVMLSYVLSPKITSCIVYRHGNSAFRFNGCVGGVICSNDIRELRMDLPNGRAAYACVLSGPDRGSIITGNKTSRVRHGFTTLGGPMGYPSNALVDGNIDSFSLATGIDTHAAGSDITISNNVVVDSAGNGVVVRSPRTKVSGNTVIRPSGTGILLTETNLRKVSVSSNDVQDGSGVGIDCPQSCPDLVIEANQIKRLGNRGIRVFSSAATSSAGLRLIDNSILGFGLSAAGVSGIETAGSNPSSGAIIRGNVIDEGDGNAAYAIRTASLTGSDVSNNLAKGSFSTSAFDLGANTDVNNRAIA